jgi:hypothetical protein
VKSSWQRIITVVIAAQDEVTATLDVFKAAAVDIFAQAAVDIFVLHL